MADTQDNEILQEVDQENNSGLNDQVSPSTGVESEILIGTSTTSTVTPDLTEVTDEMFNTILENTLVLERGSIRPEIDSFIDIGAPGKRFNTLYVRNIIGNIDNASKLDGITADKFLRKDEPNSIQFVPEVAELPTKDTHLTSKSYVDQQVQTATPSGAILMYPDARVPQGWLECDGRSILRSKYPNLFNAIGTLYGSVDEQHFNIPDLRGMFVRGFDNGKGIDKGRIIGTVQKGSLLIGNDKSSKASGDQKQIHGFYDVEETITDLNWDRVQLNDVSQNVRSEYTVDGITENNGPYAVQNKDGEASHYGAARPVNIAMKYIIKI